MANLFGATQEFVAGSYAFFYGGFPLGIVEDSPQLFFRPSEEVITGDHLGETAVGVIDRGGNAFLSLTAQEWNKTAVQSLAWPRGTAHGEAGRVGCPRGTATLTAIALDASCASPRYFEAKAAMLAPGFEVGYSLGSRLRKVDLLLLLGGYCDTDGVLRWYKFSNLGQETLWVSGRTYSQGDAVKASTGEVFLAQPVVSPKAITGITKATTAVVSSTGHGFVTGQKVSFAGIVGMKELNNATATITADTANSFDIDIDTSGYVAYSSGGTANRAIGVSAGDSTDLGAGSDTGSGVSWLNISV